MRLLAYGWRSVLSVQACFAGFDNNQVVLHVRLTELHAAHQNLPPSYSHPTCKRNHTKYTPKTNEIWQLFVHRRCVESDMYSSIKVIYLLHIFTFYGWISKPNLAGFDIFSKCSTPKPALIYFVDGVNKLMFVISLCLLWLWFLPCDLGRSGPLRCLGVRTARTWRVAVEGRQ